MPLRDDLLERAKARVGRVLDGKWHLDSVLGIGGMATVYAATHRNGKRVAIKMLHPEMSVDKQVTTRFPREGYLANTVGHPGDGQRARRRRGRRWVGLPGDGAARGADARRHVGEERDAARRRGALLADQFLDVLIAAHAKGILHRDLKPENSFSPRKGRSRCSISASPALRELTAGQTAGSTRSGARSVHRRSWRPSKPEVARKMSTSAPTSGRWARRCTRCSAASSCTKPRRSTNSSSRPLPSRRNPSRSCAPTFTRVSRVSSIARSLTSARIGGRMRVSFSRQCAKRFPSPPLAPRSRGRASRAVRTSIHRRVVGRSSFGEHQSLRDADHRPSSFDRGGIAQCGARAARLAGRGSASRSARGCGDPGAAPAWPDGRDPTARYSVGTCSADSYG